MKKILLVLLVSLMLVSCATVKESIDVVKPSQNLGENNVPMPEWVLNTPKSDDLYYAVGYGDMSSKMISMKRAKAEANNVIAGWVSTQVKEVTTTYINDAGEGDNKQALDAMEIVSSQVALASLSGVVQEEMWIDAEGAVYVLVSIPYVNILKQFEDVKEEVVDTFYETNEAAEAANEKMQEALEKLLTL